MAPNAAKDRADILQPEHGPATLTAEQDEMRLRGLRILARIIARHQIAEDEARTREGRSDPNETRARGDLEEGVT